MSAKIVVLIIIFFVGLFLYVKYLERTTVFLPLSEIKGTPSDLGFRYEDVYIPVGSNEEINAWYIQQDKDNYTILFCHGNAGNISSRLGIIKLLSDLNLNIFIFDYRGYGKSKGTPSEEGIYEDVLAAYKYLVNVKNIPPSKIIVYGKSLGSAPAVDLASKFDVRAVIIDSGFTSARDLGKVFYPFIPSFMISVKFDNINKIKKIDVPKLFIHSHNDNVVPFRLGKKLFDIAPLPKKFVVLRGSHNDSLFVSESEAKEAIRSFVDEL